jgi:hypothetical protein
MRCAALGCFAEAEDAVCAEHTDFFQFDTWLQAFGPSVYTVKDAMHDRYIEHCLLHYVHGITPEGLKGMYVADEEGDAEAEAEADGIVPSSLLRYCLILFRRTDVSPAWNKDLFHLLVKQVLLHCLPNRLGDLKKWAAVLMGHPLVDKKDVVELLARLRHSHPSVFALGCSREAWQDILEGVVTVELVGVWKGVHKEDVVAWGEAAVAAAVTAPEGLRTALAQWRYETEPFLLEFVDLCEAMAFERFEGMREELLATAWHPDRGRGWLLDVDSAALWRHRANETHIE